MLFRVDDTRPETDESDYANRGWEPGHIPNPDNIELNNCASNYLEFRSNSLVLHCVLLVRKAWIKGKRCLVFIFACVSIKTSKRSVALTCSESSGMF